MKPNFKRAIFACAGAAVLMGLSSIALADKGALDFMDPCAKVRASFNHEQTKVRGQFDAAAVGGSRAEAPKEYRALWIEAVKKAARPQFDKEIAPLLRQHGIVAGDALDAAFQNWFDQQLATLGELEVKKLVDDNYRNELNSELVAARAQTEMDLAAAKKDVDKACKKDVGSQALRVTLRTALAPFNIIAGNFQGAKRESGELAKGFRAITGISVKDGLGGGSNSVWHKPLG